MVAILRSCTVFNSPTPPSTLGQMPAQNMVQSLRAGNLQPRERVCNLHTGRQMVNQQIMVSQISKTTITHDSDSKYDTRPSNETRTRSRINIEQQVHGDKRQRCMQSLHSRQTPVRRSSISIARTGTNISNQSTINSSMGINWRN